MITQLETKNSFTLLGCCSSGGGAGQLLIIWGFWEYTSCIFIFDDLIYVLSSITHLHFAV